MMRTCFAAPSLELELLVLVFGSLANCSSLKIPTNLYRGVIVKLLRPDFASPAFSGVPLLSPPSSGNAAAMLISAIWFPDMFTVTKKIEARDRNCTRQQTTQTSQNCERNDER
jgi:hypothetical protein